MMTAKLVDLYTNEQGQGMTEYGLVLGVIAVGVVSILFGIKLEVYSLYDKSVRVIEQSARTVGLLD
ncbi:MULTISPECIES: Flp family type IVb pilin [unclassified Paenibacillus]|uniref:Flp family type IVb pilin n=1 Tax=unclassified Paenibacillus TaxID=185978 RepID=UPI0027883E68|nr:MULTISPECIES: Flp family type IVb pilin [unclassified Paenibacillus]MDQ0902283.1 pilus assembly protein Flp/PilA [Paenibacillus sp. V4I7]MDQ0919221.1 pilus assembly protein Flp/PilA [Paenibacillus sp. V4I5]